MNVRHILFLLSGSLLLGSCSDKNLAQVEQDDMYFSRKDRKELYALNNVPTDDVLVATADEQVQDEVIAYREQQTYYDATQNPDYVPGYYAAPTDGGGYDTQNDGQYYVEGYNQAQVQSGQPATNNYYFYGRSPYSYNSWGSPSMSISFGFGYSPFYSSFYSPYNYYRYCDPWNYSPYSSLYYGYNDPWFNSAYYNPWHHHSYYYGGHDSSYGYPNYYGTSYTTIVNNDNGRYRYSDGRYAVNSPRRSRSSVSGSRSVATGTTTGRRTSTGVVRSESNGRLASVNSRNT